MGTEHVDDRIEEEDYLHDEINTILSQQDSQEPESQPSEAP